MRTRYMALGLVFAVAVAADVGWGVVRHNDRSGTPTQRAVKSVHDADPVLLPTKIPARWQATEQASRSFYAVTWNAPGATSWVRLEIAVPNPPLPDATTHQKTMSFRGDARATYDVQGSDRLLLWSERGTWSSHVAGQPSDAVPYVLTGHGVDESEFFAIANSLEKVL